MGSARIEVDPDERKYFRSTRKSLVQLIASESEILTFFRLRRNRIENTSEVTMQLQSLLLLAAFLAAVCAEVKLDEPIIPEAPQPDEVVSPIATVERDPAQVLEELEHQIFDQVVEAEQARPRSQSPKKCCKLGRQVAQNGLFCSIDLMQVQKRPNVVHRRKMKFHGAEVHGKTAYKDLMRRVEKCALSKASESMFSKCCEWQEDIMYELEQCKKLSTLTERRRCRRRVQSRE